MNVTRDPVQGSQALEMTMRDVMDALEEQAVIAAYATAAGSVEIVSIEPPKKAEVHTLPRRRAEVVALRDVG